MLATAIRRGLNRVAGLPARALMGALAKRVPNRIHDNIQLVVADPLLGHSAARFFGRTVEALEHLANMAPAAYSAFRKDVERIVLVIRPNTSYQRFQFAISLHPRLLQEANLNQFAAWLLQTSALVHGDAEATSRTELFLKTLKQEERVDVEAWLEARSSVDSADAR